MMRNWFKSVIIVEKIVKLILVPTKNDFYVKRQKQKIVKRFEKFLFSNDSPCSIQGAKIPK